MGRVIILHEWDGRPYFQALDKRVRERTGAPPLYRELWIIRQLGIGLVRGQTFLIRRSLRNAAFFLRSFFLRDAVIILGMAPFDPSVVFWSRLRFRNRVFYHTSWVKWSAEDVPKRPWILRRYIERRWKGFVEDPRVRVISVLRESHAGMLERYRKDPRAFTAIPHAVDLSVFRPPERFLALGEKLRVLYLGRLNARKGIDVVAELIENADPARFAFGVAGDGPERARLEPLDGRYEYHGFVSGKGAVADLLRGYDALILPSEFEPFGIAFIEAMACGVVCVASTGLFPKDLIVPGENGFVVPRTYPAFMEALEALQREPELRERMRARGLERVREFDLDALADRWEAALTRP